jgi:hypothetical protein
MYVNELQPRSLGLDARLATFQTMEYIFYYHLYGPILVSLIKSYSCIEWLVATLGHRRKISPLLLCSNPNSPGTDLEPFS